MKMRTTPPAFKRKAACLAVASCFYAGIADANPTGASVASGTATLSASGSTLTVTNSPNAIINWQSFGIEAGETVKFIQQSASSSVLNRVTGGGASQILGTLQSNGRVLLINPAGIIFGQGASVDVGGLVASTLNITDADFLAGRMRFDADRAAPGSVTNAGEIKTPNGGFVWLLAPKVENNGVITTPSGEAVLAAGYSVELVDSTDPDQRVVVGAQSADVNLSQLMAANNGDIFSVLNNGTVSANTVVVGEEGRIYFKSAGNIQTAAISVTEAHGDSAADGGRIQAFADGAGIYAGLFGVSGRNGGFVETSGSYIDVNSARIETGALSATGRGGTWLLDPIDIFITSAQFPNCTVTSTTTCTNSPSYMYGSTIASALASGNVTIQTADGSITVNDAINAFSGTNALTLDAFSNITVNSSISAYGGVTLTAGNDINIANFVTSRLSSGFVTMSAGNNINFNTFTSGSIGATASLASVSLSAGNDILIANNASYGSTISASTNISLSAGSDITIDFSNGNSGSLTAASVSASAGGNISVSGNGTTLDINATDKIFLKAKQSINLLSGSQIAANYIGLNAQDYQTQTPTFTKYSSGFGNITIDGAELSADIGISFLGNSVTIKGNSDVKSSDQLHGIAKNDLKLDNSKLFAQNEMRLEVGGHLYLDNNSSIKVVNPNTLYFDFPFLSANGWFLEGIANFTGPGGLGSKILVNSNFAVLGQGFFVNYGLTSTGVSTVVNQTMGQTAPPPDSSGPYPPPPITEFFGPAAGDGAGGSTCTGTATGSISCTTFDIASADEAVVDAGSFPAGRADGPLLQNGEPQECR